MARFGGWRPDKSGLAPAIKCQACGVASSRLPGDKSVKHVVIMDTSVGVFALNALVPL
jgi:hypothetical protein